VPLQQFVCDSVTLIAVIHFIFFFIFIVSFICSGTTAYKTKSGLGEHKWPEKNYFAIMRSSGNFLDPNHHQNLITLYLAQSPKLRTQRVIVLCYCDLTHSDLWPLSIFKTVSPRPKSCPEILRELNTPDFNFIRDSLRQFLHGVIHKNNFDLLIFSYLDLGSRSL